MRLFKPRRCMSRQPGCPLRSNWITCGFDDALSMIVIVPSCAPCLVGENIAPIVHFARGGTLVTHVESSELGAAQWVEIEVHPRMRSIAGARSSAITEGE